LERNQEKIDWYWLSKNPNAIHLLERNQDKIFWGYLSANPSIFVLKRETYLRETLVFRDFLENSLREKERVLEIIL
jgi:hypothetical protein